MTAGVFHFQPVGLIDLFGKLHAQPERLAVAERAAAAFVDGQLGLDQVAMLLGQHARAVMRRIRQLLIGGEREDDVALRPKTFLRVFDQIGDKARRHRLVVDDATAAELAVGFLQLERVETPVLALGLDHVDMRHQEDRLAGAGAAQARDKISLARRG